MHQDPVVSWHVSQGSVSLSKKSQEDFMQQFERPIQCVSLAAMLVNISSSENPMLAFSSCCSSTCVQIWLSNCVDTSSCGHSLEVVLCEDFAGLFRSHSPRGFLCRSFRVIPE